MPGFLLTASSQVICAHGGMAKPSAPVPRVTILGQPVVTQPPPYVVAGCSNLPPAGTGPCVSVQWASGATRVTVMGQPVLLADSKGICSPPGAPVNVVPVQTRVTGA
jgi:hypothetical protein